MIEFELTFDSPVSDEFEIVGTREMLIVGDCPCTLLRSVAGSEFYPMTNAEGEEVTYMGVNPSGVVFNGEVFNPAPTKTCKFKLSMVPMSEDQKLNVTII